MSNRGAIWRDLRSQAKYSSFFRSAFPTSLVYLLNACNKLGLNSNKSEIALHEIQIHTDSDLQRIAAFFVCCFFSRVTLSQPWRSIVCHNWWGRNDRHFFLVHAIFSIEGVTSSWARKLELLPTSSVPEFTYPWGKSCKKRKVINE